MIIQRYLYREILQVFFAVLGVLLVVFVSNRFVRYLADATSGKISADVILELLGLQLLSKLVILVPLALFVATLLGLGRLYRDSEIVAMGAAGIGTPRLARSVFKFSLGFAGFAVLLSLYVSPEAAGLMEERWQRAKRESSLTGVTPGQFKQFGPNRTVYVETVDRGSGRVSNVFVQITRPDKTDVLISDTGYQSWREGEGRFVVLEDGHRYSGQPGSLDYVITRFKTHAVRIDLGEDVDRYADLDALPTLRLLQSDRPTHQAELQLRLSHPLAVVLLAMLAVPLARTSQRQGKYAKLFIAVLVYFAYSNVLSVTLKLVERGQLDAAIGSWPVHAALALVVGALLLAQSSKRARLTGHNRHAQWTR